MFSHRHVPAASCAHYEVELISATLPAMRRSERERGWVSNIMCSLGKSKVHESGDLVKLLSLGI